MILRTRLSWLPRVKPSLKPPKWRPNILEMGKEWEGVHELILVVGIVPLMTKSPGIL